MTTSQTAIDGAPVHVDRRARIEILIAVMLFLQRRPAGLFATRGRNAEA